ncbi:MAG: protein tyrosine phosphatase [Lachnospiraceae bacterium]|nr:protein tyrosine phosphatase [Lachnospiraceae bacterium]
MHTHVLPGVDDGARDLEESCALLEAAAKQGVTAVIVTPHYSRRGTNQGYPECLELLRQEIHKMLPDFELFLGQETYYHEELPQRLRDGLAFTMAGSRYVLVEFDPHEVYSTLFRGIRNLILAGYKPVLAHMERYSSLRQTANLSDLEGSGCLFQMNYESLAGSFFSSEVHWCRRQVLDGRIHMLGTDMHSMDYRPPQIDEAWKWMEKHLTSRQIELLTYEHPLRMIKNENIT